MHDVYIYDKGQDYDSLGLVGALTAASCVYDTTAGEAGEITMEHPFDDLGKWSFLQEGRILKAWVPVRVTPLINISPTVQTITRDVYKVKTNGGRLRLRQKPSTSAKALARYNPGAEVVKLEEAGKANGHTWYKVTVVKDGQTGYMAATYLTYVRSYTETVGSSGSVQMPESTDKAGQTNWTVRPQLFEIYRKAGNGEGRTVYARHISYKLLKNATTYEPEGAVTLQDALNGIMGNCRIGHDFHAYTDIVEARSDASWHEVNPIKALLDTETGAAAKWGAQVVFDNWDMFFLKRAGSNRGIRIEYGKNLVGVESNEDISNTATRIMPIGKKKDGTDLLLPELYIDSGNISRYDDPLLYLLKCSDCKVGDKMTEEQAFTEMRKRAQDMIDGGCDQPEVSLKIDFVSLGDSEEYAQFREMDKLFMYDEVTVVSERGYADAEAQVTSMSWDCIHDRVLELGVGSVGASISRGKLASWQIPSGISGEKITYGSVGSAQLGRDVVSARHVQADSINAQALQAGSVTAEKIAAGALSAGTIEAITAHINALVAGEIAADQLYADLATIAAAQITAANIDKANIEWAEIQSLTAAIAEIAVAEIQKADIEWADIETLNAAIANIAVAKIKDATIHSAQIEDLNATVADIVSADIKTADIDYAQIKNLLANKAIITDGVGSSLLMEDLVVTSANMLGATIGNLVLKSEDGRYYAVVIGTDGTIHTEEVTVTDGEIAAGQTATGQQIVETDMNVRDLNAQNIKAQEAIIAEIFTSALTAGKITAGEAMIASAVIPELYITTIRAIGASLELVNGRTNVIHRGETPPSDAGENDLWVQPGTGSLFQLADVSGLPDFYLDGEGVMYYGYGEGQTVYALTLNESGDLYVDEAAPFAMAIGPDGKVIAWERITDGELKAGIDGNKEAIGENTELIRRQSAKITELADAIDLRVTTEVYEQGVDDLNELIQKNEASITLLDNSIKSKVSQEVYDEELGAVRGDISEISQTADSIRLEVSKKNATFRQESTPESYAEGDIWIKPSIGAVYEAVKNSSGDLEWQGSVLTSSKLKTSSIEIAQDHVNISTGGSLNVDSGAAHFSTAEYTLSILAEDGSEDTVMDFDSESKTLRVSEVKAGNIRPFVSGTTQVTSDQIGGLEGLKGMLESAQYEYIIYTQTSDDLSAEPIFFSHINSLNVEIRADSDAPVRVPSLRFSGINGNVHLKNLKWSVPDGAELGSFAVTMDSGSFVLRDCYIDARTGLWATNHARVTWLGIEERDTAGGCTTAAQAVEGAEIKLYGLIPAGALSELRGGTITAIDTRTGAGGTVAETTTETINAVVGYYGTNNGWVDGELRQGYSNGKGRIYGCMRFDLPSGAANIQSAQLILHRVKGTGKGSEVDVVLYGSGTAFGSSPALGTKYVDREDAADPGVTVSLDVTAAAQALAGGAIRQLVLYNGDAKVSTGKVYSSNYALFDQAALKITY